ncbi:MAG: hypothetical protein FWC25_00160 [Dehalococcoidia bacterium]|nr:hypothetical protein [Dehalococcoidia bacterium]
MSIRRKIIAVIIALVFAVLGIGLMAWRIGEEIGWGKAADAWWFVVIIALVILLVAFLVYHAVSSKLNR